jgi:hypothetical protein
MLYQIKVSDRVKEYKGVTLPGSAQPAPVLLQPRITIGEAAYWQKRAAALLPDSHLTVQVAK